MEIFFMKITSNSMISASILLASLPAISWVIDIYCSTKVMAVEIQELQKERAYIRNRLDDISEKLSKISGLLVEKNKNENMMLRQNIKTQ
jgi:5-bromo-4-chloroindolyl phosphate hydrolysis protein